MLGCFKRASEQAQIGEALIWELGGTNLYVCICVRGSNEKHGVIAIKPASCELDQGLFKVNVTRPIHHRIRPSIKSQWAYSG